MSKFDVLSEAVQNGDSDLVAKLVKENLADGVTAQDILDKGLLFGMAILGAEFTKGDVFVPEVLMAAQALNGGTAILKEQLVAEGAEPVGTVVIATVEGDLHDIGKNLVKLMLESGGFTVVDLGIDVPDAEIIEAVKTHKPSVIALSTLLTTTMNKMPSVIKALEDAGLRDQVKVMVGGAPISQAFADEIGADAYTKDAATAADRAKELTAH